MLFKKMLRDMRNNLTQFVSIFIMSILGVLVLTGIHAEWYGMKTEVDRYYKENKLPSLWMMGREYSLEDLEQVRSLDEVRAASRRLTMDVETTLSDQPVLRLNVVEDHTLSTPYVIEGDAFDASQKGLWLDSTFALAHNLRIGDSLTLRAMGIESVQTIRGLILHPEYVYNVKDDSELLPTPESYGFAFLTRGSLPQNLPLPYNQLLILAESQKDSEKVQSELEQHFSGRYSAIVNREDHPSVAMMDNEIEQNKAVGEVFPVIFFIIAALSMLTTMTRMTSNQRTQIGILKALGFSKRKILFHYVSYGLWIGLAGGLIGLASGPLIIPPILFTMQKSLYLLPNWYAVLSPVDAIAVILAVLCCGASSYFACRKELKEVPAAALRPRPPKAGRHTRWEKSAFWHRMGFSLQWNIRDVLRSKLRSAMAVVGVIGCMALLLCALGLRDTINGVSSRMYGELHTYESKISLQETVSQIELKVIEEKVDGQWIQESAVEIQAGGMDKKASLTVLGKGSAMVFKDKGGGEVGLPTEGIGLSYKMAQTLGVKMGDTLQWRIIGQKEWISSEVHTLYRTPMGQGIAMSEEAYIAMGKTLTPTARLAYEPFRQEDGLTGIKNIRDKDELIKSFDTMLDSIQMMVFILILAAVILGVVVLYNLGALSFAERVRELATLKVLGFFSREIRSLLQKQNIWLTCLGILLGIPLGYGIIGFILSTMSESIDMQTQVTWPAFVLCVLVTFILSVGVNFLLSKKIKNIDMVSSLKAVE